MVYSNPQAVKMPDILGAVFDFIKFYGLPTFNEANIFRGYQNANLPKNSNEMCIYSLISFVRSGTNHKIKIDENLQRITQYYNTASVQVDFYSNDDSTALKRAAGFQLFARDNIGLDFFKNYGLALLYSSNPQNLSYMDESNQYVKRFGLELKFGLWINQQIEVQCFESAEITKIINVDVAYPPHYKNNP